MEIRNALSKLRLSSFKLAIVTRKWLKTKKEERICKFCDLNEVEGETDFLLQCLNYKDLRKGLIDYLISTENINLTFLNQLVKTEIAICKWLLGFVKCACKFVLETYKS